MFLGQNLKKKSQGQHHQTPNSDGAPLATVDSSIMKSIIGGYWRLSLCNATELRYVGIMM